VVRLPNQDRLLSELRGLERRLHRSGKDSFDHPRSGSDDVANSLCGSLYMAFTEARRPKMWQGTVDVNGVCHYAKQDGPRIRVVRVTEAVKGEGRW
jgi:hypothetical protein